MYGMLASMVLLKNFKHNLDWRAEDRLKYLLTDDEWEQVDHILADLGAARKATAQLQKADLTLGEFFALWSSVAMELESRQEDPESTPLAPALLKATEKRAKGVPSLQGPGKGKQGQPAFPLPRVRRICFP